MCHSPRHQPQKNYNNVPGFSDLFVIQRKFRDKGKFVSQLRASTTRLQVSKSLVLLPMRQARTSGRRRAELGRRARAVSFREHSKFLVHTHNESQVCTKSDTIGYKISFPSLVSSKLKISVRLYLSPSHLQSLGPQLRYLGDGQNLRTRTRVLMVRKAISSIFSISLS